MIWIGWPLGRVVILFSGIVFFAIFVQVTLFHYRQNFRHWSMWIPVAGTPLFGIGAVAMAILGLPLLGTVLAVLLWAGAAAGLFGTWLHVRGVGQRVDGYVLRNFMTGPPLVLPLMVSAISALGLFGLYWR